VDSDDTATFDGWEETPFMEEADSEIDE